MNPASPTAARTRALALAVCTASVLVGCGADDDTTRADRSPVYYYTSSIRSNQLLSLMTFDGGLTYGFYQSDFSQPAFPEFAYAGFFVARHDSAGSSRERAGFDFDFDARRKDAIRLVDLDASEKSLTARFQGSAGEEFLAGPRAPVDDLPTDTSALPGTYAAQVRSVAGGAKASASISAEGVLLSDLGGGCVVNARLTGRPTGNLHDATAVMSSACTIGTGSFSGHAFQSYSTRILYLLLVSEAGEGVMLLLAPA